MSKATPKVHDVKLVFRSSYIGKVGDTCEAECRCRLTPKQIVIESGTVTSGTARLAGFPRRYSRVNGRSIGDLTGWQLAPGELERLCEGTDA